MEHQKEFEQLFRQHYEDCTRFAYSLVKNTADAEEVVQEVFLKLWQKREDINIQTSAKAYLFTSIRNKVYEVHRKKLTKPDILPDTDYPVHAASNDNRLENKELQLAIHDAINDLPEKCREVFLLSRNNQFTYKQIAEQLDISVKTVENHIGKALKTLHASLKHLFTLIILVNSIGVSLYFFI